jgi:hypothetical protein
MNYTYKPSSWKGTSTNSKIPTNSRPYANDDIALHSLPRTQGKANPLKQWRKQLHPPYQTKSSKQTSFRQLDAPNSTVHMNTTTSDCDTTYSQIVKEYINNDTSNNGICCSKPVRRSGSSIVKRNYYQQYSKYLQSKCKTFDSNSTLGSQNSNGSYKSAKCSSLYTKCNKQVIYKPSNSGFSTQGAVSASAHLLKKRKAAITNNSATLKTVYGNNFVQRESYYPEQSAYMIKYVKGDPEKEQCCFETTTTNDTTTAPVTDDGTNDTTTAPVTDDGTNDTTTAPVTDDGTNDTTTTPVTDDGTNDTTTAPVTDDGTNDTTTAPVTDDGTNDTTTAPVTDDGTNDTTTTPVTDDGTNNTTTTPVTDDGTNDTTTTPVTDDGTNNTTTTPVTDDGTNNTTTTPVTDDGTNNTTTTPVTGNDISTYHTPETFSTILDNQINGLQAYEIQGGTLVSNDRIMIRDPTRSNRFYTIDPYLIISDNLLIYSELPSQSTTYRQFLSFVFQIVEDRENPGYYRIDSELHSMYSLDIDSYGNLFFNAPWKYGRDTNSGYVLFDINDTGLISYKRYKYNVNTTTDMSSAFIEDLTFTGGVSYNVDFYEFNVDLSIPSDFNPANTSYATNPRVIWPGNGISGDIGDISSNEYFSGTFQNKILDKYQSQITSRGLDSSTETQADSMLDSIFTDLSENNIRYPKEVYQNFRTGLLSTTLDSLSIVNGKLAQNNVPYVYFTNQNDHPFMVIATCGIADKPNRLIDVPTPPGDGSSPGYAENHVTRDATLASYLIKIPMLDYGDISNLTDNDLTGDKNNLRDDESSSDPYSVYNYASTSSIGIAVDGVPIYPVLNNKLIPAQEKAEITNTGIHVGRGLELHYHADGHSATKNNLNLYNNNDYVGYAHPPLIGFGYDGIALFGIYDPNHSTMEGYHVPLDQFGGHTHDDDISLGYHYHAHQADPDEEDIQVTENDYTLHILMKGAWKGNINTIPEFWSNGQPNVKGNDVYVGVEEPNNNSTTIGL